MTSVGSTGHGLDDRLLVEIAKSSDLSSPRHWIHYVYFPTEQAARTAAGVIEAAGWVLQSVGAADGRPEWVVVAEQHDVVTTPEAVREARAFFEGVAATNGPGQYDGWEASA
jgi:Regulator of ribonuclease activity B